MPITREYLTETIDHKAKDEAWRILYRKQKNLGFIYYLDVERGQEFNLYTIHAMPVQNHGDIVLAKDADIETKALAKRFKRVSTFRLFH